MPEPVYQKYWRRVVYLLAGFTALGEVLHSVAGANEIVTPAVTYLGSAVLATVLIVLNLVLPRFKPRWTQSEGRIVYLKSLGIQPVWIIVGAVILLWTPRIAGRFGKPKELDRAHYDEVASQWEEVVADPVEGVSIDLMFPEALVRARDLRAFLAGSRLTFDDPEWQAHETPKIVDFRRNDSAEDYQKSLALEVVDHAGHSVTATPGVQFWKQFEGADAWLCWWSSKFVWKADDVFACELEVRASIPPRRSALSLRTLFSFSDISLRFPYGGAVQFRGPRELPDPVLRITLWTKRGAFRLPLERFDHATEIDDNTKAKTILMSITGHGLRSTMRDQFFEEGGLPSKRQEQPGHEVHAVTGTVDYLIAFFPRTPTSSEWEKMRSVHPELVPKGY
jgi:hypothetical protein